MVLFDLVLHLVARTLLDMSDKTITSQAIHMCLIILDNRVVRSRQTLIVKKDPLRDSIESILILQISRVLIHVALESVHVVGQSDHLRERIQCLLRNFGSCMIFSIESCTVNLREHVEHLLGANAREFDLHL